MAQTNFPGDQGLDRLARKHSGKAVEVLIPWNRKPDKARWFAATTTNGCNDGMPQKICQCPQALLTTDAEDITCGQKRHTRNSGSIYLSERMQRTDATSWVETKGHGIHLSGGQCMATNESCLVRVAFLPSGTEGRKTTLTEQDDRRMHTIAPAVKETHKKFRLVLTI